MKKDSHLTNYVAALFATATVSSALAGDWPQWGGTQHKNMVSEEKHLPVEFDPGKRARGTETVDLSTTKNCKYVVKLGSQTYGSPTISGGRILV